MNKCQNAFQDLKVYLTTAPLLSPSILGEKLYLYLAMFPHVVSSALIREEGKVQKPVLLYKPGIKGGKRTISYDGKVGIWTDNSFQVAKTLLPGSCHQYFDRSSIQEGNEQVGNCRMTDPMGYRA